MNTSLCKFVLIFGSFIWSRFRLLRSLEKWLKLQGTFKTYVDEMSTMNSCSDPIVWAKLVAGINVIGTGAKIIYSSLLPENLKQLLQNLEKTFILVQLLIVECFLRLPTSAALWKWVIYSQETFGSLFQQHCFCQWFKWAVNMNDCETSVWSWINRTKVCTKLRS